MNSYRGETHKSGLGCAQKETVENRRRKKKARSRQ